MGRLIMDIFGIKEVVLSQFRIYRETNRATGRTNKLLDVVTNNDVIITDSSKEKFRLEFLIRELGKHTKIVTVNPEKPDFSKFTGLNRNGGNVYFDHHWTERYYQSRINEMTDEFNRFSNYLNQKSPKRENISDMWI